MDWFVSVYFFCVVKFHEVAARNNIFWEILCAVQVDSMCLRVFFYLIFSFCFVFFKHFLCELWVNVHCIVGRRLCVHDREHDFIRCRCYKMAISMIARTNGIYVCMCCLMQRRARKHQLANSPLNVKHKMNAGALV